MAIVHYTAHPAVGGIESLIVDQCTVLQELGHTPVCIVGSGSGPDEVETIRIPWLDPGGGGVGAAPGAASGAGSDGAEPPASPRARDLETALAGCTDCWVMNALTLTLHPALTDALATLIPRRPDIRWVGWTADISSVSRFVPRDGGRSMAAARRLLHNITWVAISDIRASEVRAALGGAGSEVRTIHPPLDVLRWLGASAQTRTIARAIGLLRADLTVFVPAKALPHKDLARAVRVGAALSVAGYDARVLLTAAPSSHQPAWSRTELQSLRTEIRRIRAEATVFLLSDLLGQALEHDTVRDLMQLCDVVFIPSLEEGFGMPLREAAALGVPVVCRDLPVFHEVGDESFRYFGGSESDDDVASLLIRAASERRTPARRAALASMERFRGDVDRLLKGDAQPNV